MADTVAPHLHERAAAGVSSRLSIDIASAAITSAVISPLVCLIDSTIVLKAASPASFRSCCSQIVKPWSSIHRKLLFTKPFALVFAVYFGTYATANSMDSISAVLNDQPAATISTNTPKFLAIASISTALTVYKDKSLAQILGSSVHKSPVPAASYCLFVARDALTIAASFNLPPLLAPKLAGIVESEVNRLRTTQFILPVALQFVSTPIHLLGLDLYNRSTKLGPVARIHRIRRDLGTAIPARMVRVVPAFGIGGVLNTSMRTALMQDLEQSL